MPTRFFHGSSARLKAGTLLLPNKEYRKSYSDNAYYLILERFRPSTMIPHHDAVFMVDDPDNIEMVGGLSSDYIYQVAPSGKVERHAFNWGVEVDGLVTEFHKRPTDEEVVEAAFHYWHGDPWLYPKETIWEYLVKMARVVRTVM